MHMCSIRDRPVFHQIHKAVQQKWLATSSSPRSYTGVPVRIQPDLVGETIVEKMTIIVHMPPFVRQNAGEGHQGPQECKLWSILVDEVVPLHFRRHGHNGRARRVPQVA